MSDILTSMVEVERDGSATPDFLARPAGDPGTEHAIFNDTRPEAYAADAATDARRKTLELFFECL